MSSMCGRTAVMSWDIGTCHNLQVDSTTVVATLRLSQGINLSKTYSDFGWHKLLEGLLEQEIGRSRRNISIKLCLVARRCIDTPARLRDCWSNTEA